MKNIIFVSIIIFTTALQSVGQSKFEKDVFKTPSGKLTIIFIGHASLMFNFNGKIIHVDPWNRFADYKTLPKADIILVTHHHPDHLDTNAITMISKNETQIILTSTVYDIIKKGLVMSNGDKKNIDGIEIEALPAYNTTAEREKYHPKDRDNGYVLTIGKKRIYIAGDTENIPEMASLINIDIAFLPMNQPYTMLPEQVADAVNKFNPKILYPYHYNDTDVSKLKELMSKNKNVEIRIKPLK
ncbi:MAG: MBL fold metallo-hydrolase [Bacteroidetes bacterium]|nr:MBL fold metallo-hydrolase [Bacteroidota bacterium]MBU1421819.1 MBL fold metallo-hydrolase [Bacteroidota bacterium]MBU2636333.1 MBL fold metallo-hydrolase [Bacteroidota bacterium]